MTAKCKRCGADYTPEMVLGRLSRFCPVCQMRNMLDNLDLPTPPDWLDRHTKKPTLTKGEFQRKLKA